MQGLHRIAVDWGTTNRRAFALDAEGEVIGRFADGRGISTIEEGGFSAAVDEIFSAMGQAPMMLAGMVGSNRGWLEAPYVDCPATIDTLLAKLKVIPNVAAAIVPGVRWIGEGEADVMRGEEVQILGAVAAGLVQPDCIACHPGTHSKWVVLYGGAIVRFHSAMTGELFALLKNHSIIADQLCGDVTPGPAFEQGVRRSLARCRLAADLFSVRARGLMGLLPAKDAAPFASGLLIGADVRIGLELGQDNAVALIGDPRLTELYAAALRVAGRQSICVDGETAFIAGIRALTDRL